MSDLLKEAIADAKAVRETALQNAKAALEEAFTPQLKSMLSAKLREEDQLEGMYEDEEDEEELDLDEPEDEEDTEETHVRGHDDEDAEEGHGMHDEMHETEEGVVAPAAGAYLGGQMAGDDFPGGKAGAAALGAATGALLDPDDETEEGHDYQEENLDLESVIRELEEELGEGAHEGAHEGEHEEEDEDDKEEGAHEGTHESVQSSEQVVEEEYEIDEAALEEDESEDLTAEEVEALYHIANNSVNELAEYKEAVHFLKDKLHEVNILNAKLLYTNKLFKEYSLDNNQKLKVVETFDRAQTTREIKLVFSTIAEQLNENVGIPKRKPIKESASAPVSSTKPSKESQKVITEEEEVANRFKKLAGLIKG